MNADRSLGWLVYLICLAALAFLVVVVALGWSHAVAALHRPPAPGCGVLDCGRR